MASSLICAHLIQHSRPLPCPPLPALHQHHRTRPLPMPPSSSHAPCARVLLSHFLSHPLHANRIQFSGAFYSYVLTPSALSSCCYCSVVSILLCRAVLLLLVVVSSLANLLSFPPLQVVSPSWHFWFRMVVCYGVYSPLEISSVLRCVEVCRNGGTYASFSHAAISSCWSPFSWLFRSCMRSRFLQ